MPRIGTGSRDWGQEKEAFNLNSRRLQTSQGKQTFRKNLLMRRVGSSARRGVLRGPCQSDRLRSLFAVLRLHGGVGHGDLCGFPAA